MLVITIMAAVSRWEREAIGDRTRDAVRHKRPSEQRVGNIRFGFCLNPDGKHVQPDPGEQSVLTEIASDAEAWRLEHLRMRAINHYRLDGDDSAIVASRHTVFDFGLAKQVNRQVELNFSLDNLTNRDYYETQNYFESRVTPEAPVVARIHGTPGFPLTAVAEVTLRFRGK